MINVGIESTSLCAAHKTGIANYTYNLVNTLIAHKEFNKQYELSLLYKLSRYKKRNLRYLPDSINAYWHYASVLPFAKKFDIVHSPDAVFLNYKRAKKVVTIHDLAIFKTQNQIKGYTSEAFKLKMHKYLTTVSKNADAIITVSETTKRDFLELFDFNPNAIFVTHLGLRFKEQDRPIDLTSFSIQPKKYLLFAGAISIRKNILNLIKAYKLSGLQSDYKLVLAGSMSMGHDEIVEEIKKNKLENEIVITGFVSDENLQKLYKQAAAFVFPTYYEGFGLPIVEAMHAEIPVLIGNKGAATEIAGGYAVDCNPFDIDSIAAGIKRTIDLRDDKKLSEAKLFAEKYTWENCAERTIDVYNLL
jgi:glycosyltransferase involved in cell wall biosynthesis